uniref:Cytoplasmic tRNA 2-thiolation protein 2 n=1 Tax=Kalanchoe fedtschenkoi TaxID=63787 RepID=A0A7N1A019_KALFE
MACSGSSGCQSAGGCSKIEATRQQQQQRVSCVKCKASQVMAPGAAGEDGRYCPDCFRGNLFGKFRFAVTSNSMISPTDRVLVAFSGGPCSRVALQFVHDMQQKAQRNFDASPDRSLPVFSVGVAFIDESSIGTGPLSCDRIDEAVIKEMETLVSCLSPPSKKFHAVPIQNVYPSADKEERVKELVQGVPDDTGKEDLLLHLRMLSLQTIAREHGYTKLVLGSCTSQIACHVLSSTVKGRGYSLPADIQYVDSRWDTPVVLPLRDCLAQEISILCRLDGLKTLELQTGHRPSSINSLVSSFVKLLQEDNPSRESTIVRTAGKLIPFHFNRVPENLDGDIHLASRHRKKFQVKSDLSIPTESFCSICVSPLKKDNSMSSQSAATESHTKSGDFAALCCSSCRYQILPSDAVLLKEFYTRLPHPITERAKDGQWSLLRERIEDYLLSENGG